jgi:hypothetical protein
MNIERLVECHKFFRRSILVWAMSLATYMIVVTFSNLSNLTAVSATVFGSGLTILTGVIGLYQFLRGKDDQLLLGDKNESSS